MPSDMSYTPEEYLQRRVDTMEWAAPAMTEEERLERRRFEAYFAFESEWQPKRKLNSDQFAKVPDGS
jgi:hypothetical protein